MKDMKDNKKRNFRNFGFTASFTRKDVWLSDDYVYERKKSWYV